MRDMSRLGPDSTCVSSQDVPYPVEAVVQVGGYVLHQVTAADQLKTGDQVQLHLDQVGISTVLVGSWLGPGWVLGPDQKVLVLQPHRSTGWPAW